MYRFYDLEMVICEAAHKKDSFTLRRQIASYQKSLNASKAQRQVIYCMNYQLQFLDTVKLSYLPSH